jgi:hypothetical protein
MEKSQIIRFKNLKTFKRNVSQLIKEHGRIMSHLCKGNTASCNKTDSTNVRTINNIPVAENRAHICDAVTKSEHILFRAWVFLRCCIVVLYCHLVTIPTAYDCTGYAFVNEVAPQSYTRLRKTPTGMTKRRQTGMTATEILPSFIMDCLSTVSS